MNGRSRSAGCPATASLTCLHSAIGPFSQRRLARLGSYALAAGEAAPRGTGELANDSGPARSVEDDEVVELVHTRLGLDRPCRVSHSPQLRDGHLQRGLVRLVHRTNRVVAA